MATSKHQLKVDDPACGHKAGIQAAMNPKTGEWIGKCPKCGAPAKVEMQIETPSGMQALSRKKFGVGNRVIVGINRELATVKSIREEPGPLGEYVHEVLIDGAAGLRTVLGSEIEAIPIGFSASS
jgi:hypothetical protein